MNSVKERAEKLRNCIVTDNISMYRILGYTDQFKEDLYWLAFHKMESKGPVITLYSCVAGFLNLKEYLPPDKYEDMDHDWNINGLSVEDGIRLAHKKQLIIK